MREIKFRQYDSKLGVFLFWRIDNTGYAELLNEHELHSFDSDRKANPIEQFTGLKDKNGVEIYEGDILTFNVRKEANIPNSKAFYGERGVVEISPRGTSFGQWDSVYCTNLQVIGNIHENPKLLGAP